MAALATILFVIPVPLWTRAEGATWPAENSQVRASADGFVRRVLVEDGSLVKVGQPLIELTDPFLEARLKVLEAQLRFLQRTSVSDVAIKKRSAPRCSSHACC